MMRPRLKQSLPVPREHLKVSEQMMAQCHRLRHLEMREARHHRLGMLLGAIDKRAL